MIPQMRPALALPGSGNPAASASFLRLLPIAQATGPRTWHNNSPRMPRTRIVVLRLSKGFAGAPYPWYGCW